jgi:hypothetical protein
VLLVFLAAVWLRYDRLEKYTFGQIREAIAAMPTWHTVAASLLTVLSYVILKPEGRDRVRCEPWPCFPRSAA